MLACLPATRATAWENHSLASYRAFENMPEVAGAPNATVERLEAFLKSEENTLEALLASQEAWAVATIDKYPVRPAELAFKADPGRSDEARRQAFLKALRIAPDSRFALYSQNDPWNPAAGIPLPMTAVSSVAGEDSAGSGYKYLALKPDDQVSALTVLATATDEPDLGLDARLFDDNGSEWGRRYGFGPQPFGNPLEPVTSQAPFHMGFMHEGRMTLLGVPAARRSLVLLRSHQYSTIAALAFRTGHAYWGWRFAGLSLHYLQDLTQPYRAALSPGESNLRLLSAQILAFSGLPARKEGLNQLRRNRCLVLEKYQTQWLLQSAESRQESALEKALRNMDKDKTYPEWNDRYVRDVVSLQASRAAPALALALLSAMPEAYVMDARIDFASLEAGVNLSAEMPGRDMPERLRLDTTLAELLGNLGAHSRNALRGILRATNPL
jgi:hypothetical protein